MPRQIQCSICQSPVLPRKENPSFPFCSPRCRLIDLGKWLGEEYRIPERRADREDESAPSADGEPDDGDAKSTV
ncbi:MAG TPA: DNA gyrase inhibitor YacG [Myxococcaceae bacterium]|nr:DNA gyrase inhibitor YacG [Myxococcaceae bacterium]